jgi:hypothetical protein
LMIGDPRHVRRVCVPGKIKRFSLVNDR